MDINPQLALTILGFVGTGGIAWGAVKVGLNGSRTRIINIEKAAIGHVKTLNAHAEQDHINQLIVVDRLARIETKLDQVIAKD